MNFTSLFTGIGGFDLGLERAGLACSFQVEKDPYCNIVLKKHYPNILREGDVRDVQTKKLLRTNLVCGGTPCQDLSVAGTRRGLAGSRSQLFWEYYRIVKDTKPEWLVWENVFGALYSNRGRDFARILVSLEELGYFLAWRVLDAQYWGIPQRRRRVFLVGCRTDGRAAKVLFDPESISGGSQSRPEKWSDMRPTADDDFEKGVWSLDTRYLNLSRISGTLQTKVSSLNFTNPIIQDGRVRRFSPIDCETLQGFPRNWTEDVSDFQRYKQLGNAVAVPVVEWLGKRMLKVNKELTNV